MAFRIKRVYEDPAAEDGYRVLVDRLWPRGLSKERAELDEWNKDVAPSTALRTWFHHDPLRFTEFAERYRAELDENPAVDALQQRGAGEAVVSLLFSATDPEFNQAVVLREYLAERAR
jgi:uncharacterized protein YeaO (DUF488 family)